MSNIPIYVINLKRTPERKLYIQRQLDSFGLECQWIEAIDAQNFKDSELEGVDLNDVYQPGAMACLLSHVEFYDQMIQNGQKMACVLEDDAYLLPSFPEVLNYEKLQKEDWEILLLCHHSDLTGNLLHHHKIYTKSLLNEMRFNLYDKGALGGIVKNFPKRYIKNYYIGIPYGNTEGLIPKTTTGYLIRLSAAKKLREIALANQNLIYADDLTGCAGICGVSLRVLTPPCIRQNITYLKYSLVLKDGYDSSPNIKTSKLPDEELLQLYIRNRWKALTIAAFTLKIRLLYCFLCNLKKLWETKIKRLFPNRRYNIRMRNLKI